MLAKLIDFRVTPERRSAVIAEITDGSTPAKRFYVMVVISNLIAVLGLVANSPAVIIGAMLVAPLMTPIFGISLALIQGDSRLLARAVRAEVFGVALAIFISLLFGLLPLAIKPTPEMLARTHPNLLDLMVAVLAGFAGAYAMVDERISPSLPGVAIATAIVPPLANTGLCFALGEYMGGMGSFLLFLANFLSILLASSVVFAIADMRFHFERFSSKEIVRRFGVAIFTFLLISIGFTFSLSNTVKRRYVRNLVERTLTAELSEIPGTTLREYIVEYEQGGLDVLATVWTPALIEPMKVEQMQQRLADILNRKVDLVVRNNLVKDIAATGSTMKVATQNLDGEFIEESIPKKEKIVTVTEQVLWEKFSRRPGFQVSNIEYHDTESENLLLANVLCLYPLNPQEIQDVEEEIRNRLGEQDLRLVISSYIPILQNNRGKILFEWSRYKELTEQKSQQMDLIQERAQAYFAQFNDVFLIDTHFRVRTSSWEVLFEVTGTRMIPPEKVAALNSAISEGLDQPLEVHVWFRNEAVVSEDGLDSYKSFMEEPYQKKLKKMQATERKKPPKP